MRTPDAFCTLALTFGLGLAATSPALGSISKPLLVVRGDFDGDGFTDRVQAFPRASDGAGRVDVFWGDPSHNVAWPTVLSGVLDPGTRLETGQLGEALAVGDFDGDGLDDLAIGAPKADPQYLLSTYTNAGTVTVLYGCGAAPCASVDTDGAGVAAVGSSLDPSAAAGAQRIWQVPPFGTPTSFARFGKSLAAGDFDDDGYDDLAIGAPGDSVGGDLRAGSVTIVYGSASGLDLSTWQMLDQDLLGAGASPAEPYDHFGAALGAARLNGDDADDLAVGVPDEDYGTYTDVGEVDVFWGSSGGLSAASYDRFRHTSAMVGGGKDGDRLGADLSLFNAWLIFSGALWVSLDEAVDCGGGAGFLAVPAGGVGSGSPAAVLNCDVDICDAASAPGDGALPEIPVNFIVVANAATVPAASLASVPGATWSGADPITGAPIGGADYFEALIELLNQQVRSDDGDPVCDGQDCVRFAYRSHSFFSSSMFTVLGANVCPRLHAISNPSGNILGEDPLAFTDNCDSSTCPLDSSGTRHTKFSNFAEEAVDECGLLVDSTALNVIVYDVCERDAGADGVENTSDDVMDCTGARSGRARQNSHVPYAFVDYDRTLQARTPASGGFPWAAEDHEVGHALGLSHACEPAGHGGDTRTMQTGSCVDGLGSRNAGFATASRTDLDGDVIVETEVLVQTARDHTEAWLCP